MIRRMEEADICRVAEIHVFGWRSAFRGIVSDEVLLGKMSVQRSSERFSEAFKNKSEEVHIFDDGLIKAFISICPCRDEDKPTSFELAGIYVEPLLKGQGIGRQMVAFCEKTALEQGYKENCLWTPKENMKSRRFYENMGYIADGKTQVHERLGFALVRYGKKL